GARRQPAADAPAAANLDLRLDPQDRLGGPPAPKPDPERRRRPAKTETRQRARGGGRKSGGKRARIWQRPGLGRLFYWLVVLGLWLLIAAGGTIAWVGAHLPAIQSLEVPRRPPGI